MFIEIDLKTLTPIEEIAPRIVIDELSRDIRELIGSIAPEPIPQYQTTQDWVKEQMAHPTDYSSLAWAGGPAMDALENV